MQHTKRRGLLARAVEEARTQESGRRPREVVLEDARLRVQRLDVMPSDLASPSPEVRAMVLREIRRAVEEYSRRAEVENLPPLDGTPEEVAGWIEQRILGYGALQSLFDDDTVEEILIDGPHVGFFIDGKGKHFFDPDLEDARAVVDLVNRLLAPTGKHLGFSPEACRVDARVRLPNGAPARIHATCSPVARHPASDEAVYVAMRKYLKTVRGFDALVQSGSLTPKAADFLRRCVLGHLNVAIGGPTGSGKTTLAMIMLEQAPSTERIVVIEEVGEIFLDPERHLDVVYLETVPRGPEGTGEVTLTDLVKDALRLRPERIVLGEARGGEVLDVVMAHNTGHSGGICTVHANDARETVTRLMDLMLLADKDLSREERARFVAQAFHIVVFLSKRETEQGPIRFVQEILALDGNVEETVGAGFKPAPTTRPYVRRENVRPLSGACLRLRSRSAGDIHGPDPSHARGGGSHPRGKGGNGRRGMARQAGRETHPGRHVHAGILFCSDHAGAGYRGRADGLCLFSSPHCRCSGVCSGIAAAPGLSGAAPGQGPAGFSRGLAYRSTLPA